MAEQIKGPSSSRAILQNYKNQTCILLNKPGAQSVHTYDLLLVGDINGIISSLEYVSCFPPLIVVAAFLGKLKLLRQLQ